MKLRKIAILLLIICILAGLYLAERHYLASTGVHYRDFGIVVPAGYTTHGIDVSHHQNHINWKLVNEMRDRGQRISFALIKATEGTWLEDSRFRRNWREVARYPLLRGAYLYFHPNYNGKNQAEFFINRVPLRSGDLPPIVDIEETGRRSSQQIRNSLKQCLSALEARYGVKPIIYSGVDYYEQYLGDEFNDYPLWAAHYVRRRAPRIGRNWMIWQHNCRGRVNGIKGAVDFNVINGNLSTLKDLCIR